MATPAPSSPPSLKEGASAHHPQVEQTRGRARSWRWLVRVSAGVAVLCLAALGSLLVLLLNLSSPWLKAHVQTLIRARTGLDLDYGALRIASLGELQVEDLVVRSPSQLRAVAPELVRVARLHAEWSPSAWLSTEPMLTRVDARHVVLTSVLDEHGRTTFDALPAIPAAQPTPSSSPSRVAGELTALGALLSQLHVHDGVLILVRTERQREVERITLRGLSFDISALRVAAKHELDVSWGAQAAPLALVLGRQRGNSMDEVELSTFLAAHVTHERATASLMVQVEKQPFFAELRAPSLHVDAEARFEVIPGRTVLEVRRCQVGDDIARASALLTMPDKSTSVVQHAEADVDIGRLVQLVPHWLLPLRVERGQAHVRAVDFTFGTLSSTSSLAIRGEVQGVQLESGDGQLAVAGGRFALDGRPSGAGVALRGDIGLAGVRLQRGAALLRTDDLRVTVDGSRSDTSGISGELALHFGSLESSTGSAAVARDGQVVLRMRDVFVPWSSPLSARGDITLKGAIAQLSLAGAFAGSASGLRISMHAPLTETGSLNATGQLAIARIRVSSPRSRLLVDIPVATEFQLRNLSPNLAQLEHSQGRLQAVLEAGALHASLQADKTRDSLDYDLGLEAAHLTELIPFLPPYLFKRVPWSSMGVVAHSRGRVENISSGARTLRQQGELTVSAPGFDAIRARSLGLTLQSTHTHSGLSADATLQAESLTVSGSSPAHPRLQLTAALDRKAPHATLRLTHERLPAVDVEMDVGFDSAQQVLSYQLRGEVAQLSPIEPLLSQLPFFRDFELSKLALQLRSDGNLKGIVFAAGPRADLTFSTDVLRTATGQLNIEAHAQQLRWSHGDSALVQAPSANWRGTLQADGTHRTVDGELDATELELGMGRYRVGVSNLRDKTAITLTGDITDGTIDHTQQLSVGSVRQRIVPGYPLGDLTMALRSRRTPDGLIKISAAHLENRAGGTILDVSGGMELGIDRRRLSVRSTLQQDLARLSQPQKLLANGKLVMELLLSSPDFRLFHTRSKLKLADASISLPSAKIALQQINGELPIVSDWTVDRSGVDLLRGAQINPYATQRFSDQHPLLSQRSFISIAKVSTPVVSVAPFAANLTVERNILSLSQMEMGVRGGTVTGNGTLRWEGASSMVEANVRATGVRSSRGEPFDGNAALLFDARDRSIEGRADILRIGKRHLLDLLDVQDPRRVDPALNGVRRALRFGYPDRVKISFKHGFASAGVSLGGLGSLLKIPEVRGLPVGPMVERVLSSLRVAEEP